MSIKTSNRPLILLREDFRHCLEQFYASLHLAPPYHSLEEAIRLLSVACERKSPIELEHLLNDSQPKWKLYEETFLESGLALKHRGIIRGLIQSGQIREIPVQYRTFLRAFQAEIPWSSEEP